MQNNSDLIQWYGALQLLQKSKPQMSIIQVLCVSSRNLVLMVRTLGIEESVIKISHLDQCLACEVECLSEVSHPNIITLLEVWAVGNYLFVEFAKAPGHCLVDLLVEEGWLSESECQLILKQVLSALNHLHSKGWIHRDLKPDNLIWHRETGTVKLIDFEFAGRFRKGEILTDRLGTLDYMSPEMRKRFYQGPETELWSLGVTLFTMLSGQFPFSEAQLVEFRDLPENLWRALSRFSNEAQDLIQLLLSPDPRKRCSVKTIEGHRWLQTKRERRKFFLDVSDSCVTVIN